MSSSNLESFSSEDALAAVAEVEAVINPPVDLSRFVVYGSRVSGALDFVTDFRKGLAGAGIADANVVWSRDAANIAIAFFNLWESNDRETLPRGVVVFPEMRQNNFSIDAFDRYGSDQSPFEYIADFCRRYRVPIVAFQGDVDSRLIPRHIRALLAFLETSGANQESI